MKNYVLTFITGLAIGNVLIGAVYFKYSPKTALSMLAIGSAWLALFIYANCRSTKKTSDEN